MKRHGNSCPSMCSQCTTGAPVRIVTVSGADVLIDGEPTGRTIDREGLVNEYFARRKRRCGN